MGLGVDIGIDAEGDRRHLAHGQCAGVEHLELGFGFNVEAIDVGGERRIHFAHGLADAGKHDLRGRDAGCQGAAQFAFGNHIDT
jgi:hypothetical protein